MIHSIEVTEEGVAGFFAHSKAELPFIGDEGEVLIVHVDTPYHCPHDGFKFFQSISPLTFDYYYVIRVFPKVLQIWSKT